jgi:hypothetical protein
MRNGSKEIQMIGFGRNEIINEREKEIIGIKEHENNKRKKEGIRKRTRFVSENQKRTRQVK